CSSSQPRRQRSAAERTFPSGSSAPRFMSTPARRTRPACCARVGNGVRLALQSPAMKSRLLIRSPREALQELGWTDGRNLRLDYRWGAGDAELFRKYAEELVALAPDVILATGNPVVEALQRVTRTVPIVFVTVADPVGAGFVESL